MGQVHEMIDLRDASAGPDHTRAFYALRELHRGQVVDLLIAEPPETLMRSLSQQLRYRIHWETVAAGADYWRVRVRHRDDVEPAGVMDVLMRDHERLDRLFAQALQHVNANAVDSARPLLEDYGLSLRRHIHVENDILAPGLPVPRDGTGTDPVSVMLREHDSILEQLHIIGSLLEDPAFDAGTLAAFMALLSATLAKHEAREEQNLFPLWDTLYRHSGAPGLLARVKAVLAGAEDGVLG